MNTTLDFVIVGALAAGIMLWFILCKGRPAKVRRRGGGETVPFSGHTSGVAPGDTAGDNGFWSTFFGSDGGWCDGGGDCGGGGDGGGGGD